VVVAPGPEGEGEVVEPQTQRRLRRHAVRDRGAQNSNRVGPKGILQAVADVLKLLLKEGITPQASDKFLFNLAPFIVAAVGLLQEGMEAEVGIEQSQGVF